MATDRMTFSEHLNRYMPDAPFGISMEKSSFKMMRLQEIRAYLKYPTPIFKPQYNIIVHLTQGTIKAQVGFNKIEAKEKSVLLMLSNKMIAREFLSEDLEGFVLIIEDSAFSTLLSRQQSLRIFEIPCHILLSEHDTNTIADLNTLVVADSECEKPNEDFRRAIIQAMLVKLLEHSGSIKAISRTEEIAFGFKRLMYQHFQEEHSIAFYADCLRISESHLNRCSKAVFHKSSKEIWTEIIIQYSQVLLQDVTKEIAEVAYMLNFADPSYFGRLFKQVTGLTPTEYRTHHMRDLSEHLTH